MSSITLFGAGSWGTALAAHLAKADRDVTLWARRPEAADRMRHTHHNTKYRRCLLLPDSVQVTSDVATAAGASDLWAMAVPSPHLRSVAERIQEHGRDDVTLVSLTKGIEKESLMTMTQMLDQVIGAVPAEQIGVLHGPSHSEEVGKGQPTTVVAAAPRESVVENIRDTFMTDSLCVYGSTDVTGVEVGGSAKNVLAIAAGISDGVGYGDNVKAALMTRGLAEMRRLGVAMGGRPETFSGLTGIGDLIVTCTSQHSRNRYMGEQVGQGKSLEEVRNEMGMVAEGTHTAKAVYDLAQTYDLKMPIATTVYTLLLEDPHPQQVLRELVTQRSQRERWLPEIDQQPAVAG
ncbi:MAG: glycerol-3-phosphate dehydrogenase [Bacteroidetes bacterium SW_9_63_38]|nr:MAG: glycerol-3-phosphate dehydrogenase [Bacteroidetes bacterium SW_9_63_38]